VVAHAGEPLERVGGVEVPADVGGEAQVIPSMHPVLSLAASD
jgi:hypothetical protein